MPGAHTWPQCSVANGVGRVLSPTTPCKIGGAIIQRVAIQMARFHAFTTGPSSESQQDQSMHIQPVSLSPSANHHADGDPSIPLMDLRRQDSRHARTNRHNLPVLAGKVSIEVRYRSHAGLLEAGGFLFCLSAE